MFGMIARITAVAGRRDELIAVLTRNGSMPGCRSYIVARDAAAADDLLVTEVWDSKQSHDDSLAMPEVKAAIAEGRPLIAGFATIAVTEPVGGIGLPRG
jgi:quinol monooxygenase YgiN